MINKDEIMDKEDELFAEYVCESENFVRECLVSDYIQREWDGKYLEDLLASKGEYADDPDRLLEVLENFDFDKLDDELRDSDFDLKALIGIAEEVHADISGLQTPYIFSAEKGDTFVYKACCCKEELLEEWDNACKQFSEGFTYGVFENRHGNIDVLSEATIPVNKDTIARETKYLENLPTYICEYKVHATIYESKTDKNGFKVEDEATATEYHTIVRGYNENVAQMETLNNINAEYQNKSESIIIKDIVIDSVKQAIMSVRQQAFKIANDYLSDNDLFKEQNSVKIDPSMVYSTETDNLISAFLKKDFDCKNVYELHIESTAENSDNAFLGKTRALVGYYDVANALEQLSNGNLEVINENGYPTTVHKLFDMQKEIKEIIDNIPEQADDSFDLEF